MKHEVVIAGGGPTGMMLAAELALARVDVAVVERRPDPGLAFMDPVSRKYIGKPFPMRNPEGRVALVIEVEKARYIKLPFEHTPPKSA